MKISIITATYNSSAYIADCLASVNAQTYKDIEHIIIDGKSTDNTLEIIESTQRRVKQIISEPDNGIYDALNKGIKLATGDVIGFLHADDLYSDDNVITDVAKVFAADNSDSIYADLVYVNKEDTTKVFRKWKSGEFNYKKLKNGWMPPHPTFFIKREIYEKYGLFNLDFKIAADYEIITRLLRKHKISTAYLPREIIKMRVGGASNKSLKNIIQKSKEDYKAMKMAEFSFPIYTLLMKNLSKVNQFL